MKIKTTIIRSNNNPDFWSALIEINGRTIETDIRPQTRKDLEQENDVEVDPSGSGETYQVLILTKKKSHATQPS